MTRLVLFDVDLTLIASNGVGSAALTTAFLEVLGVELDRSTFDFQGRTDRSIQRELARRAGVLPAYEERRDRLVESYLGHLVGEVERRPPRLLPGVFEAVLRLEAEGLAVGLVTGNVERGARIKLAPTGLDPHFPAGGFGDRHEERADVVREAIAACSARSGDTFDPADVVVVGDTERDLWAGRDAGTRTVGVATGSRPVAWLADCGAGLVLEDLTAIDALVRFVTDPE